jgi:hypothetical protein
VADFIGRETGAYGLVEPPLQRAATDASENPRPAPNTRQPSAIAVVNLAKRVPVGRLLRLGVDGIGESDEIAAESDLISTAPYLTS